MSVETPEIHVIVQFPFRGFFGWHERSILYIRHSVPTVDFSLVVKVIDMMGYKGYQFNEAYEKLTQFSFYENGVKETLTEEQKFDIMNAMADRATRNIEQEIPYDSNGKIIMDPFIKRVFSFSQNATYEEIVHKIYIETKANVFSYTVHNSNNLPILVRNAYQVSTQHVIAVEAEKKEADQRYLNATQQAKLRVSFPYRALFRWDGSAQTSINHPDRFTYWNQESKKELQAQLSSLKQFKSGKIVKEYDTAWWALSEIKVRDHSGLPKLLTQEQKQDIISVLTVPGTRGVQGNFSYVDRRNPTQGLIMDPAMTQEITVPIQPNNNYFPMLQQMYGAKTVFSYEII